MDISEVAKKSGVAASALRYYERKGLIHSLESEGSRRKFSPAVLDQLALIALQFELEQTEWWQASRLRPAVTMGAELLNSLVDIQSLVKRPPLVI